MTTRVRPVGTGELYWDELWSGEAQDRVLVLSGFGRTADEMFLLTALLAHNGFHVACPDFRNHAGRSTGDIYRYSLSSQIEDVAALIHYTEPAFILATSLSARAALAAAGASGWVGLVVGLLPVVSPVATVSAVTGSDWSRPGAAGQAEDLDLDGYRVSNHVVVDAFANGLDSLEATIDDARALVTPPCFLASPADTWVALRDVVEVASHAGATVHEIDGSHHDFARSFRRARSVFHTAAEVLAGRPLKPLPTGRLVRARAELRQSGCSGELGGGR